MCLLLVACSDDGDTGGRGDAGGRTDASGGNGGWIRPADLPPPFVTGAASMPVQLDADGCLDPEEDVVIETEAGVRIEIDDDTCFETLEGNPITGSQTLRLGDGGGIDRQGRQSQLQGVLHLTVDGFDGEYIHLTEPLVYELEVQTDESVGAFELVSYLDVRDERYAFGPTDEERTEVTLGLIAVDPFGPERIEIVGGTNPFGVRFVEPDAAKQSGGCPDCSQYRAPLEPSQLEAYPRLCSWSLVSPRTGVVLAAGYDFEGVPHGTPSEYGVYSVTVDEEGAEVVGIGPFLNRLVLAGSLCGGAGQPLTFETLNPLGVGGSPDEVENPGVYDGLVLAHLSGKGSFTAAAQSVFDAAPNFGFEAELVRARAFGDAFQVTMVLRGYGVSVRRLQGDLPTDWLHDPYDRETFINVNPFFDFRTGSQGWRSVNLEGSAVHLTRSTGVMKLDGVDESGDDDLPNASIERTLAIPPNATTLEFDVSAHDRQGADARYRVRVTPDGAGESILIDWTVKSGVEGSLTFEAVSTDLSAYAGQSVTLHFDQDANGAANEQIYIDNVWIR